MALTVPLDYASKNFKWSELECKCGCGTKYVSGKAIDALQHLRYILGLPLRVLSAARCPKHNWAVNGAKNSKHLSYKGKTAEGATYIRYSTAFDIALTEGLVREALIEKAKKVGFNGFGSYKTFVHIDIRDVPGFWRG